MTPNDLHTRVAAALEITGMPDWPIEDAHAMTESLEFFESGEVEEAPTWAFVAPQTESDANGSAGDYEPVATELARRLILEHLRRWLAVRGWQVQAVVTRTGGHWRLADCLSLANGGGDRLDADYPYGEDELAILSDSVLAVHTGGKAAGAVGP